ncbi:MAG: hypothetical protein ABIW34_13660 [Ginsengibacter sp.]
MKYVFKSFFATLMLTMVLTSTFGKQVIELKLGTDGNLTLSDGGRTEAFRGDTIIWSIMDPNIISIEIVKKHWYTHNIFIDLPEEKRTKEINARINKDLWFNWNFKYTIIWTDNKNTVRSLDPIISIKPTESFSTFLIILVIGIVSLPLLLLRRNRIRKKRNIH